LSFCKEWAGTKEIRLRIYKESKAPQAYLNPKKKLTKRIRGEHGIAIVVNYYFVTKLL
jgi:hypothetical protein